MAKPAQVANQAGVVVHRGSASGATGQLTALVSAPKIASGPEAVARIKGSEAYGSAQGRAEATARDAGASAPAPGLKALTSPTIRAASFPASVPEDK